MKVPSQIKQPSTYAGLAVFFEGISDCLSGNYSVGLPKVILGAVAVLKNEQTQQSAS